MFFVLSQPLYGALLQQQETNIPSIHLHVDVSLSLCISGWLFLNEYVYLFLGTCIHNLYIVGQEHVKGCVCQEVSK